MTLTIRTRLTAILSGIITVRLSEDISNALPYAVYDLNVSPTVTKAGGVVKYSGTLSLSVFADDYNTAKTKGDQVAAAIEQDMNGEQYRTAIKQSYTECNDGVWRYYIEYIIGQYS